MTTTNETTSTPIRIGVIGLGAIGERLIEGFQRNQHLQVVAVCDALETRAAQVAEQLGGIAWYTSHQDLLAGTDVDLVYVAVPPKFHHAVVLDALAANKHILCEKPLANSLNEAAEMLATAKQACVVTAMNFPMNYHGAVPAFEKLLREGYIGKLERIEFKMHFPQWPRAWQQNAWVAGREQGGYVLEVGVHFIQMMQRVFGSITRVKSQLEFPSDPQACEIGIEAQLELADGTPIYIDGKSQVQGEELISLTAFGDKGQLAIVNWAQLQGAQQGEPVAEIAFEPSQTGPIMTQLVNALTGQPANLFDFEVGYNAQVILEALRHPEHGDWVDVQDKLTIKTNA
ncbi:MAG: Gfo/Idh/MocA family protein [Tumebacillaceae bacterium]